MLVENEMLSALMVNNLIEKLTWKYANALKKIGSAIWAFQD